MHPELIKPTATEVETVRAAIKARMWQRTVARRAIKVVEGDDHYRVLHPTKGWRFIHKRRLGLA